MGTHGWEQGGVSPAVYSSALEGSSALVQPLGPGQLQKARQGSLEQQDGHHNEASTKQQQQPHGDTPWK